MPSRTFVLVIEDEAVIRMDVADQLRGEGFQVLEAGDAPQAIALLEKHDDRPFLLGERCRVIDYGFALDNKANLCLSDGGDSPPSSGNNVQYVKQ